MPKPTPKDQYRMTIALNEATADFDYRANELAFLRNRHSPLFECFVRSIGLWDNFTVSRGMDIQKWTVKDRWELLSYSRRLLAELDAHWNLYGHDYWYRGPTDMSKRKGREGVHLLDGRHGLLGNRIPGELALVLLPSDEVIDLRPLDELIAESPPRLRFYRKPNDIRWRERLAAIIAFVEANPTDDALVRVRHHYVNDPAPKPAKKARTTK